MPYGNWYALATLLAEDYSKVIGVTTDLRDIRDFLDHIRICFIVLTGATVTAIVIYIVGIFCGVTRGHPDRYRNPDNYLNSRTSSRAMHNRYQQRAPSYSSAADDVELASRTSPTMPTTPTSPSMMTADLTEKRKSFPLDASSRGVEQRMHLHAKVGPRLSTVDEGDDQDSNNDSDDSKHDPKDSLLRSSFTPVRPTPYRASIPADKDTFPPPPSMLAEIEKTSDESESRYS